MTTDQSVTQTGYKQSVVDGALPARVDRFDRRFSVEGDPLEALKVVLTDNSGRLF